MSLPNFINSRTMVAHSCSEHSQMLKVKRLALSIYCQECNCSHLLQVDLRVDAFFAGALPLVDRIAERIEEEPRFNWEFESSCGHGTLVGLPLTEPFISDWSEMVMVATSEHFSERCSEERS